MLDIQIDDDDLKRYIRTYIDQLMERKVYDYLQHQLKNVVEGRLAALRLNDPNSQSIHEHIEKYVQEELADVIEARIQRIIPDLVRSETLKHVKKIFANAGDDT